MRIYRAVFEKNNRAINLCFLLNAMGSGLLMPLALLYLVGTHLSAKEILYLGTVKFWSYSLAYFIVIPSTIRFDSKKVIIFSLIFKLISLSLLFYDQSFYLCLIVMLTNGIATSFFSVASKYYIKATAKNMSESFSVRMTLNNTGAAISPMMISAFVYFSVTFTAALLTLILFFIIGIVFSTGLKNCPGKPYQPRSTITISDLINKDAAVISVISILFSMLYYTFEVIVPLELVQSDNKSLIGPVMLFNTGVIILGQIPVYRYLTEKWGIVNAILIATGFCILLFIPWFFQLTELPGLLLIVIGVTFLEMFYGAGIDTLITSVNSDRKIAILDGISGMALAIGAAVAAVIYGDSVMFMPLVITLFILIIVFNLQSKNKSPS
ncbi:MFS transporter [Morganella psychrotolerans]|uniref:MFS transporter n=1 Tax=Morganella psychrotolerans TaxID=368603 RepID=UPI0039AF4EEE